MKCGRTTLSTHFYVEGILYKPSSAVTITAKMLHQLIRTTGDRLSAVRHRPLQSNLRLKKIGRLGLAVDSLDAGQNPLPFPWYVELAAAMKKEAKAQEYIWERRESDHSTGDHFAEGLQHPGTWRARLLLYVNNQVSSDRGYSPVARVSAPRETLYSLISDKRG